MTTATETQPTQPTISLSNFRVVYHAPRYEDGRVLYDGYCAVLADDAALDGAEVRVFDVPDVDEGQLAAAMFACEAMNQHDRMRAALKAVVDFYAYHRQGNIGAMAGPLSGEVLSLVREALATTTSK